MTGKVFLLPRYSFNFSWYLCINYDEDTPQSCGLPSIEEHTGEYPPDEK